MSTMSNLGLLGTRGERFRVSALSKFASSIAIAACASCASGQSQEKDAKPLTASVFSPRPSSFPVALRSPWNGFAPTPQQSTGELWKFDLTGGVLHGWKEATATRFDCADAPRSTGGRRRKTCQFVQVMLSEGRPKIVANFDERWTKFADKHDEMTAAIREVASKNCANGPPTPRPSAFAEGDTTWRAFCSNPSYETYRAALVAHEQVDRRSCKVSFNPYSQVVEEKDNDTWESGIFESGCEVTGQVSLTRSTYGWRYRQVRFRPAKPPSDPKCKDFEKTLSTVIELESMPQGYWWGCDTFVFE